MPRKTKDFLYKNEQVNLLVKILDEIGINNNNLSITRDNFETDNFKIIIQKYESLIREYYTTRKWTSIRREGEIELNLFKNICRNNNIIIDKIQRKKKENDKLINVVLYKFSIPNEILNNISIQK